MKRIMALAAVTVAASAAVAQERTVSLSRVDGLDTVSAGAGLSFSNVDFNGSVSWSDAGDWSATMSNSLSLYGFSVSPYASYSWGNGAGDIVGWGDDNEWGSISVGGEAGYAPGIIGGEYLFLGAGFGISETFDFEGGSYGIGYGVDLAPNITLDGRMTWDYDSEFEIGEPVVGVSLGLSF